MDLENNIGYIPEASMLVMSNLQYRGQQIQSNYIQRIDILKIVDKTLDVGIFSRCVVNLIENLRCGVKFGIIQHDLV